MRKCLSAFFHRWNVRSLSAEQVIEQLEITELRRRLESGLSPNDNSSGRTLLNFAIAKLSTKNFDPLCAIICLLLAKGANPNAETRAGTHPRDLLFRPSAYNAGLVKLFIAYGADFSHFNASHDQTRLSAKQECETGCGRIATLKKTAMALQQQGDTESANEQLQQAIKLLGNCLSEKGLPAPVTEAYQTLHSQLNEQQKTQVNAKLTR